MPSLFTRLALRMKPLCSLVLLSAITHAAGQSLIPSNWVYQPIDPAYACAYSPDGKYLAVGGSGGVQLFTAATRAYIRTFPTSAQIVFSVAFSPDSKTLAGGGGNVLLGIGTLETWNVSTAALTEEIDVPNGAINSVAFSPDGTMLVEGGTSRPSIYSTSTGIVEIRNASNGQMIGQLNSAASSVNSVAFSPDGTRLAVGGQGVAGVAEIWNLATKSRIALLPTAAYVVNSVAYSPNGKSLALGGWKYNYQNSVNTGILEIWDSGKLSLVSSLPNASNVITAVSFSPDGSTIAAGMSAPVSVTQEVGFWSVATGASTGGLVPSMHSDVFNLCYSPKGSQICVATASYESIDDSFAITAWNTASSKVAGTFNTLQYSSVWTSAMAPNGKSMSVGGTLPVSPGPSFTGFLNVLNTATGTLIKSIPTSGTPRTTAYSPDGTILAAAGPSDNVAKGTVVEIWNPTTAKLEWNLATAATKIVSQICFSPDGTKIAIAGQSTKTSSTGSTGIVEVWSATNGKLLYELPTICVDGASGAAFSPDSQRLIDVGYGGVPDKYEAGAVELWDVSTGKSLEAPYTDILYPATVAFSPDGSTVAIGGSVYVSSANEFLGGLELIDLASLTLIGWLPVEGVDVNVTGLQFSPNGQHLYVAANPMLHVFDMATLTQIAGYSIGGVRSLSLSDDASQICFTSYNWLEGAGPTPGPGMTPVSGISLNYTSVESGATPLATVTIAKPAPQGGIVVPVFTSSALATVPRSVIVPAGSNKASFYLLTGLVSANTSLTISAGYGTALKTAKLMITPPVIDSVVVNPYTVKGGGSSTLTIVMDAYAPVGGVKLTLSSSSSVAAVPATVTVPAGKGVVTATVTTTKVSKATPVTITVKFGTSTKSIALVVD